MLYQFSDEWTAIARQIATELQLQHIKTDRVSCIVSRGSKARTTIARIHSLNKVLQHGMHEPPCYVIELLHEHFGPLSHEDKIKTIIHELLHIPAKFSGGFRHHRPYVNKQNVERCFRALNLGFLKQ